MSLISFLILVFCVLSLFMFGSLIRLLFNFIDSPPPRTSLLVFAFSFVFLFLILLVLVLSVLLPCVCFGLNLLSLPPPPVS